MRDGIAQMDAKYVLAGGTINKKTNVATPLMMLQDPGDSSEVIPFQKGEKCFGMTKFLDWAEAGDVHLTLTDKLETTLKEMSVVKLPRVKRVRSPLGAAEVQVRPAPKRQCKTLSESEVLALLTKERKKWASEDAQSAAHQELLKSAADNAMKTFKESREYRAMQRDVKAFREAQEKGEPLPSLIATLPCCLDYI